MHRMHRFIVLIGLAATSALVTHAPATASLIKPDATRAYPDIAADINGRLSYTYDAGTQTGQFEVTNTPFLIGLEPTIGSEVTFDPLYTRRQAIKLTVDASGKLVASAGNSYEMYGKFTYGGHTYEGLLLKGTPTNFGFQDHGDAYGGDAFDVELDITGGALADYFGKTTYMEITPRLQSTFRGLFTENFTAIKAESNTRTYDKDIKPFPIPEPSTWVVVALGAGGLAWRRRRAAR